MFPGYGMSNATEIECLRCEGATEIALNDPRDPADLETTECPECDGNGTMTLGQARNYVEWLESRDFV